MVRIIPQSFVEACQLPFVGLAHKSPKASDLDGQQDRGSGGWWGNLLGLLLKDGRFFNAFVCSYRARYHRLIVSDLSWVAGSTCCSYSEPRELVSSLAALETVPRPSVEEEVIDVEGCDQPAVARKKDSAPKDGTTSRAHLPLSPCASYVREAASEVRVSQQRRVPNAS